MRDGRWARLLESSTTDGGRILLGLDVTSTRKAEEERDELSRTFKSILDHAPFALVIKGADLTYRLTNNRFARWHAPPGKDPTGATYEEVTGNLHSEVTTGDSNVLASGEPAELEAAFSGHDPSISRVRVIKFRCATRTVACRVWPRSLWISPPAIRRRKPRRCIAQGLRTPSKVFPRVSSCSIATNG